MTAAAAAIENRTHDVLVVGAGPAGIAAATRAGEQGLDVVLVDEGFAPGGQIWRQSERFSAGRTQKAWRKRLWRSGAMVLSETTVCAIAIEPVPKGARPRFRVTTEYRGTPVEWVAAAIVLATGARELFLPFPGWTLPGVVGIGGIQALVKGGLSVAGKRVVIGGSGPLLLPVAASLKSAGARVLLVAEQAPWRAVSSFAAGLWYHPGTLAQAVRYRAAFFRTPYHTGEWVSEAWGDTCVRSVTVTNGRRSRSIDCDFLAAGFGLVPNTELARLLGCAMLDDTVCVFGTQETSVTGVYAAGEPTGIGGVDLAIVEGEIAGLAIAGRNNKEARKLARKRDHLGRHAASLAHAFALRSELRALAPANTIICRCEDVRIADVRREWSPRQAKLYTRVGMGPCQGRVCGAALHFLYGWPSDSVRPPSEPVLLSTLAGAPAAAASKPRQRASR